MSQCKYCGIPLFWQDAEDGSHVPYEDENYTVQHKCPKYKKPAPPPKQSLVEPLSDDEVLWVRNLRATLRGVKK